jgi:thioredoxin-like negative regulator of GroEL
LEAQLQANPKPAETYLVLAEAYVASGQRAKASALLEGYFGNEADAKERCASWSRLSEAARAILPKKRAAALQSQCPAPAL